MEANRDQSPGSDEATSPTNAKKRLLSYEESMLASSNMADDKKGTNRGNYRCSRCNLPKKGHKCPYQPVFRKRDYGSVETKEVEIQVELDANLTLIMLGDLNKQGLPESYILSTTQPNNPGIENAHAYPVNNSNNVETSNNVGSSTSVSSDPATA